LSLCTPPCFHSFTSTLNSASAFPASWLFGPSFLNPISQNHRRISTSQPRLWNPYAKAARLAPCSHSTPRFDIGLPFGHLFMDGLHAIRAKYKADDEKSDSMNNRTLFFSKVSSSHRSSFEDAWAEFASQYSKIRIGVERALQNQHFNIWRLLCRLQSVFAHLTRLRVESLKYF
jgi:hypothetical protein